MHFLPCLRCFRHLHFHLHLHLLLSLAIPLVKLLVGLLQDIKMRNSTFINSSFSRPSWEPDDGQLRLLEGSIVGPIRFMNPTQARYDVQPSSPALSDEEKQMFAQLEWNARDSRKGEWPRTPQGLAAGNEIFVVLIVSACAGRHVLIVSRYSPLALQVKGTSKWFQVLKGIGRMFTLFPVWDISWWVGVSFTIGCVIFILDGLLYWLPVAFPETKFANEDVAGGVLAFVGATLFQIGAILLFFESVNQRAEVHFGKAIKHMLSRHDTSQSGNNGSGDNAISHSSSRRQPDLGVHPSERTWTWWPTWEELRTHYVYEIGFWASLTMSIGATIFYVSGIMALPWIYNSLSDGAVKGAYLLTYLVGGVFFMVSSCLYTLEVQPTWYRIQPKKIGWHIGVWNFIGGTGWTLAASFGYCTPEWCSYQSYLALAWASTAFTIGSAMQWYESLDKYVVIVED